jgi:hypothetical protein
MHSPDITSQPFKNFYTFVTCTTTPDEVDTKLIFYKLYNLVRKSATPPVPTYYVKKSSFFPQAMNLAECIAATVRALGNIVFLDNKNLNFYNFLGIDTVSNLAINITYKVGTRTIFTFFPMFKITQEDVSDLNLLTKKYNKYSDEAYQNTISEKAYLDFMAVFQSLADDQKTFRFLTDKLNELSTANPISPSQKASSTPSKKASVDNLYDQSSTPIASAAFSHPSPTPTNQLLVLQPSLGSTSNLSILDPGESPKLQTESPKQKTSFRDKSMTPKAKSPTMTGLDPFEYLKITLNALLESSPSEVSGAAAAADAGTPDNSFQVQ